MVTILDFMDFLGEKGERKKERWGRTVGWRWTERASTQLWRCPSVQTGDKKTKRQKDKRQKDKKTKKNKKKQKN